MLEYLCPPQTHHRQTRKWRPDRPIETGAERPPKRARLTEKNLKAFDKMAGRARKSTGKKSTGKQSTGCTTTTTDKAFGIQLQQNNVIYTSFDAQAPYDVAEIRELLDRPRESQPPDHLAYNRYLVLTEDHENERGVKLSAYPLLSKRIAEREISGYFQRPNHAWSAVDNHLTTGLGDAQPDIVESYRETDYPPRAVEALSGDLAPSSYNEAMPAYAVEFKSSKGDMREAKLQCAYDGALMTEGARAVHKYMNKPDDDFYGKTQALTAAFNGRTLEFYGHHAVQIPASPQPAASDAVDSLQYHQYLIGGDTPRNSFENFQSAYKHTRNAEDFGYRLATQRKDALWAYTGADNTQTSPDVTISAQQPSRDFLVPLSPGTPARTVDSKDCDDYDCDDRRNAEDEPSKQLLAEFYASFTDDNQDEPFVQIPAAENGHGSPDALIYTSITPPQSSKDVSIHLSHNSCRCRPLRNLVEDVGSNVECGCGDFRYHGWGEYCRDRGDSGGGRVGSGG